MTTKETYLIIFVIFCFTLFIYNPPLCFLLVGFTGLCYVIFVTIMHKKIQRKGIECKGTIVSFEITHDGYKTPIVEFTTFAGQTITSKPFVYLTIRASSIVTYEKLPDIEPLIIYNPDNPKYFVLKDENFSNNSAIILGVFVCLAFIIGSICNLLGYIDFH